MSIHLVADAIAPKRGGPRLQGHALASIELRVAGEALPWRVVVLVERRGVVRASRDGVHVPNRDLIRQENPNNGYYGTTTTPWALRFLLAWKTIAKKDLLVHDLIGRRGTTTHVPTILATRDHAQDHAPGTGHRGVLRRVLGLHGRVDAGPSVARVRAAQVLRGKGTTADCGPRVS